jgi:methylmalonyl-CoA/ethylmalonyl-CoA epimerase
MSILIKRITEIGVAVKNLMSAGNKFHEILGAQRGIVLNSPEYDMAVQMFRTGNIEFELMQPASPQSIIAQFLKKRGEGPHHLAFEVEDIAETITWMKKHNVKIINNQPVSVDDLKASFLHPESFGGVLIELIEGIPKHVDNSALPSELQTQVPVAGVGAEGILEVGIFVRDLEDTSAFYSEIFSSEALEIADLKHLSLGMRVCRVGNVALKLMEMRETESRSVDLFTKNQLGLNYVTLKVRNLEKAVGYLQEKGVTFAKDPLTAFYESTYVFIDPKELSGISILLKE